MKKHKPSFILLVIYFAIVGLLSIQTVLSQDPHFTQFYANPVYLNPGFTGTGRCPRVIMNFRNQWPAIPGTFVTYAVSYDQHVDALHGGLGLYVMNDRAGEGTLVKTKISGIYSYQMNVNRHFSLKAGFEGTLYQFQVDWDMLTFPDMIDAQQGFIYPTAELRPNESLTFVDFAAGLVGFSEQYYGGVAVHHLTEPDEAFINPGGSKLPMKITAHAGASIPLDNSGDSKLSPNVLYHMQQDFKQLNLGLYLSKSAVVGGLWFRQAFKNADAFMVLVGVQHGRYKFKYSYDVTVSKLGNATAGSHELSLVIRFPCSPGSTPKLPMDCPLWD